MAVEKVVTVKSIDNPLQPSVSGITEHKLHWREGMNLSAVIAVLNPSLDYVMVLNGQLIQEGDWGSTRLRAGDFVVISDIPRGGGGGGKGILRIALTIAIVVAAAYTGGAAAGFLQTTYGLSAAATTAVGAGITAAVTIAGTMALNALLPPPTPDTSARSYDVTQDSQTYGFEGPKNTAREGIAVPICYGRHTMAGNLISLFNQNDGDDQNLYMLINAGEGSIAGFSDIRINDQPYRDFDGANVATRLGSEDQSPIPWFGSVVESHNMQGQRLADDDYIYFESPEIAERFQFDFYFPRGLVAYGRDSGNKLTAKTKISIEYSPVDENTWQSLTVLSSLDRSRHTSDIYLSDLDLDEEVSLECDYEDYDASPNWIANKQKVYGIASGKVFEHTGGGGSSVIEFSSKKNSTVRRSVTSVGNQLDSGTRYKFRFKRLTKEADSNYLVNQINISEVKVIRDYGVGMSNTALLALRVKATDQLNQTPKVTFRHLGKLVKVYDPSSDKWFWRNSSNPAWIVWDMMTNTRYGAGIKRNRIILSAFIEWAEYCEEHNLQFNGVFDVRQGVWDAIKNVARVGRSQIIMEGTKFWPVVYQLKDPVMLFNNASIIKDSFSITYIPSSDRANVINYSYFDKTDSNRQKTVKLVSTRSLDRGDDIKELSVVGLGIDNYEQAREEAKLMLNMNEFINRQVSFSVPTESLAVTLGDVVMIQHDMPSWDFGGRVEEGCTTTEIILDGDYSQLNQEDDYQVFIQTNAKDLGSVQLTQIVGDYVYVDAIPEGNNIKRLVVNGNDYEVKSVKEFEGIGFALEMDSVLGLLPGMAVNLWDTDVIEMQTASFSADAPDRVTTYAPFSFVPSKGDKFMVGPLINKRATYQIQAISGDGFHERQITCIEYTPELFISGEVYEQPGYGNLNKLSHSVLSDNGFEEELLPIGDVVKTRLSIDFYNDSPIYRETKVLLSRANGEFIDYGNHFSSFQIDVTEGELIRIKLVARDTLGRYMAETSAPEYSHTVVGKLAPPQDVKNAIIEKVIGGIRMLWDNVSDIDLAGYSIKEGDSWDSGVTLADLHKSTNIFIPISSEGQRRYWIKAVDTSGNESESPLLAEVDIDPPSQVTGFLAVQDGNLVSLRWDVPITAKETGIEYIIRKGDTWKTSVEVARTTGDTYKINSETKGDKIYWIKARDIIGLMSKEPSFATVKVDYLKDRNVIKTDDHSADGYPGRLVNLEKSGDRLQNIKGRVEGDYLFKATTPYPVYARNLVAMTLTAVKDVGIPWEDATFTWDSEEARQRWLPEGEITDVDAKLFMSGKSDSVITSTKDLLKVGLHDDTNIDGYNTVYDENGDWLPADETPSIEQNVVVDPNDGRFVGGAVITTNSQLEYDWPIAVSPIDSMFQFWVKANSNSQDQVIYFQTELYVSSQANLKTKIFIGRDGHGRFFCRDDFGRKMRLSMEFNDGELVLIAFKQTEDVRKFYVGKQGGEILASELEHCPLIPEGDALSGVNFDRRKVKFSA